MIIIIIIIIIIIVVAVDLNMMTFSVWTNLWSATQP